MNRRFIRRIVLVMAIFAAVLWWTQFRRDAHRTPPGPLRNVPSQPLAPVAQIGVPAPVPAKSESPRTWPAISAGIAGLHDVGRVVPAGQTASGFYVEECAVRKWFAPSTRVDIVGRLSAQEPFTLEAKVVLGVRDESVHLPVDTGGAERADSAFSLVIIGLTEPEARLVADAAQFDPAGLRIRRHFR